jgi:hypothetical protein
MMFEENEVLSTRRRSAFEDLDNGIDPAVWGHGGFVLLKSNPIPTMSELDAYHCVKLSYYAVVAKEWCVGKKVGIGSLL